MRISLFLLIATIVIVTGCGKSNHRYQGYVEGDNTYLSTPFGVKLLKAFVNRRQPVKKGDLLFILDPKPEQFILDEQSAFLKQGHALLADLKKPKRKPEIDAIKAKIAQADAQISLAAIRVKRNEILYNKHVMDKDTLDAAMERLKELQDSKAEIEANLEYALLGARDDQIHAQEAQILAVGAKFEERRWEVSEKQILAPEDGVIFDTYYRLGEFVSPQRPIAALLAPENIHIEFFVPLDELQYLHVGKKITYSYFNSKESNEAVIGYISPEAEYIPPLIYSRTNDDKIVFRVKADLEPGKQRLLPGEPVTVSIEADHAA